MVSHVERHFGMDWLRIAAFGLLILYHVGMAFVAWPYEVKVSRPIDWVAIPMLLTSPWRLSLLFAISGYASGALLSRSPGRVGGFIRGRLARLGIPLLFGMAVLVTPQPWVALVTQHDYPHDFGHFVVHDYYRFQFIDGVAMPTWMHLWFVVYLLAYTLVLAALLMMPKPWREAGRRASERVLAGWALLLLPMVLIMLARSSLSPGWLDTHMFFNDWSAHAVYLPVFLFGYLLRGSESIGLAIERWWTTGLVIAVLAYAGIVCFELKYPGTTPIPQGYKPFYNALRAMQMWGTLIGLIGLAGRFWNRDHPWRATLAEAVFPFYIIHQTIIVVVGYWLLPTATGAFARFAILTAATGAGCWLFYLAGRSIASLRPLVGLKSWTSSSPSRVSASPRRTSEAD